MGSRVFQLGEVLARVGELKEGERLECLEYSLGSLYLGTSAGRLLQYGLAEWRDSEGRRQFSANHIASVELVAGQKISLLHAAPAINRLLAFCDSTLFILSLADLSVLPMAGSNKLRGLSAVCVDTQPSDQGPYCLQVCVAKKKQGQLALLNLSEDKLSVLRTRECAHPVLSMALAGPHLCCAHPHTYSVYNMDKGSVLDLFPLDGEAGALPPPVLATGPQEFLLLGPGNLGMFVRAGGEAGRPPVQWSCAPSHLVVAGEHLLSLGMEGVAVHGMADQQVCPGLNYLGGRWAGQCDGTIFLCTGVSVSCLSPLPWQEQAQALLEAGDVDRAVALAEDRGEEGRQVLLRAGFLRLQEDDWTAGTPLLLRGECDPREVVSLVPGLLPSKSKFVRSSSSPPLHSLASLQPSSSLVSYLRAALDTRSGREYRQELHTALARLVALTDPSSLSSCLSEEATAADCADLASGWSSSSLHHFSALATQRLPGGQEEAARLWASMASGQLRDSHFPGLDFLARQLSLCPPAIVFAHCDLVLSSAPHLAVGLFRGLGRQEADTVLNILSKYQQARLDYLTWLVVDQSSPEERHHTQLAMALISSLAKEEQLEGGDRRQELSHLILTSHHLNAQFLLQQLRDTDLYYEQAILQGKLGAHDRALDLLVNKAKDYQQAETYCSAMAAGSPAELGRLLLQLLKLYLGPGAEPSVQDSHTIRAVELLNSKAEQLPGPQVLELLPPHWNISIILPALRRLSRGLVHEQRMTKVTKHLSRGENIQLRAQLASLTREPLLLLPSSYCVVCTKPFSGGGVARYPNGVTLHSSCVSDDKVCPLTGQVFSVAK